MAIIEVNKSVKGASIGLWEIKEPTQFLLSKVREMGISTLPVEGYRSELRKAQWAGVRLLLNEMMGGSVSEVVYDKNGKPHLSDNSAHISISHSREMVAVIIDEQKPTGIDIEIISPKVKRIKTKFLSDVEQHFVDRKSEVEHLLALWCSKEALYKAYGKKSLIYKENIIVHPFLYSSLGTIKGTVKVNDYQQDYALKYEKLGDYMLVYVLNS